MKKFRLLALLCLFYAVPRFQAQTPPVYARAWVQLAWNPSPSANVTGYNIYTGTMSHNYTNSVYVPGGTTTMATLSNLLNSFTYYFNITAVDKSAGLESDYDGEVIWTTPAVVLPPAPSNLHYKSSP